MRDRSAVRLRSLLAFAGPSVGRRLSKNSSRASAAAAADAPAAGAPLLRPPPRRYSSGTENPCSITRGTRASCDGCCVFDSTHSLQRLASPLVSWFLENAFLLNDRPHAEHGVWPPVGSAIAHRHVEATPRRRAQAGRKDAQQYARADPLEYRPSRALARGHWLCSYSKQDPSTVKPYYRSTT